MNDGNAILIAEKLAEENEKVIIVGGGRPIVGEQYGYALTKALSMAAMASSMGFGLFPETNRLFRPDKPKNVCLLPECDNLTNHNKGYCSAKCFKKSRSKS